MTLHPVTMQFLSGSGKAFFLLVKGRGEALGLLMSL